MICRGGFWAVPFLLPITDLLGTRIGASNVSAADQLASASVEPASSAGPHSRYGARWRLSAPARAAADYARAEKAEATRRAYRSDFELFRAWCAERHVSVSPASPESVAAFLAHEAERQGRPTMSVYGRRSAVSDAPSVLRPARRCPPPPSAS